MTVIRPKHAPYIGETNKTLLMLTAASTSVFDSLCFKSRYYLFM